MCLFLIFYHIFFSSHDFLMYFRCVARDTMMPHADRHIIIINSQRNHFLEF